MPVTTRAVSRLLPSSVPEQRLDSGFDGIPTLSTFHQRFTHVRLSSAHLTGLSRLFLNAHYPGHCAGAASGGLDPGPAARVRGADPHLLCSSAAFRWPSRPPFRAFVAHSRRRTALRALRLAGEASLPARTTCPSRSEDTGLPARG